MSMSKLFDEHIEIVKSVNESTGGERAQRLEFLNGFRSCAKIWLSYAMYARMLCSADDHYLSIGVDRPMCCGVFLTEDGDGD